MNNDAIAKLTNATLSRAELAKSLYIQRESLEAYEVGQPRTVCTNSECIEVRSDFQDRNEAVTVYKTMCHKPCYLGRVVQRNQKGHEELKNCWAINRDGFCNMCRHNYLDHMHVYYDYRPTTTRLIDEKVNQDLIKNASDMELQRKGIEIRKAAIEEFRLEHMQVQEAAIQFGFFLKRHAIEPYNDATIEYVDYLIDVEKLKIRSGGRKETLTMLEKYKAEHLQRVAAITASMARGDMDQVLDDRGVRQLIDSLYGLPHFGDDLKRMVDVNEKAADAIFREKTFNVTAGVHWGGRGGSRKTSRKGGSLGTVCREADASAQRQTVLSALRSGLAAIISRSFLGL